MTGAMRRIDDDRQMGNAADRRDDRKVEGISGVVGEGSYSTFTENDLIVSFGHDVLGCEQKFVKSTAASQQRYSVPLELVVNDKTYRIMVTLADRAHMLYPVLLGRNFLTGNYTVDTSKQFVRPRRIVKEQL